MSSAHEAVRVRWMTLEEAAVHWDSILSNQDAVYFYHTLEWYTPIQTHLLGNLSYAAAHLDDEPIALFPLMTPDSPRRAQREFHLPVHSEMFLCDCLIANPHLNLPWATILFRFLLEDGASNPTTIRFPRIPTGGCIEQAFPRDDRNVRRTRSGDRAYCDVADPDSLNSLSTKHLRNISRLTRKAGREFGSVRHITVAGSDAARDGLDLFTEVEASGWKGPDGTATSLSCQPTARGFYKAVLERFGRAERARVDVLTIDDQPAAAQFAIRCGSVWNLLKVGFDETFSSCGPGNILLKRFIEHMVGDPEITQVSLVTAPDWARRWHMDLDPTFEVTLFAETLSGRMRLARHDASVFARRLHGQARRLTAR